MGSKLHFLAQLFSRRISRRVAFWIFASIVAIEAIILVPSARRQEREFIRQLEDHTSIKITWLVANLPKTQQGATSLTSTQADTLLQELQAAVMQDKSPMLALQGAVVYDNVGQIIASFGDRPTLDWQAIEGGQTYYKNWTEDVYDSSWSALGQHNCTLVIRHNIAGIKTELIQYKLRIGLLVIIISLFVTASTLIVMQILVIAPILKLREDLQTAGELVISNPEQIHTAELHSLNHQRKDELGDVMDEFRAMLTRITTEIQQRIEAEQNVRREQEKSEELLLNILPAAVAEELKENRHYVAEGFSNVSVLFADIVGFTALSANKKPAEIVTLLNDIFSSFDRLSEIYGLEKIKTIGDAYMVAGGLPMPQPGHAMCMADMALEMLSEMERLNQVSGYNLQLRIGIHCGSVVAGVIGTRKFIYDLWGDSVNVASRMESLGLPNSIQVTEAFHKKLGDQYCFQQREAIDVKGKGLMQTYFLLGKKVSLARTCQHQL
ncbi:adenylate/guanylate cyclase [[Leptolyngbya] sp. PCC 7376]|uniref:adenylate/guanylate cyclase domain-containing protein n=1 Tax=[Leptolyngbya] sp. PCC 7376 TaxID=111781 RepID=UPI00029EEAAD|nr:adenylate/guanylate cyclase domain-containing protein [[Leptolyngbya] sp. PCC 7376]AFY37310.1 adenylate/guanylate cyclase [[Leptolyngbya] sp. PCC 7376]